MKLAGNLDSQIRNKTNKNMIETWYILHLFKELLLLFDFCCRTFTYYNTGVRESIEDVAGYIYELPPTTFANESINPHNW